MKKVTRLFEYLDKQLETNPLDKSFGSKHENQWIFYSTNQLIDAAQWLSSGLLKLGIRRGDTISVVTYNNRPEWYIVDLACQYIGAITVPLYPTISAREYEYILNDAQVKVCFVGSGDLWEKVHKAKEKTPSLLHIFTLDEKTNNQFYEKLMTREDVEEVRQRSSYVHTDDIATIIYTSGTTGNPKGVMLSHANIIHVVNETLKSFPLSSGKTVLSFLPFCHIFERASIYGYTDSCVKVYCTGIDNLAGESGDLVTVRPHFFTTVPRLLEKVYEKIISKGNNQSYIKKQLFFWALSLSNSYQYDKSYSGIQKLKRTLADKLIFKKVRKSLGGRIECIVTGAAPCPEKILKFFCYAGIPIMEGYGLTETSPTISINKHNGDALIGTTGPVIDGIEVIIEKEGDILQTNQGEILVSGPNVMRGYWNKEKKTNEVFCTIEGKRFFRTGDIGLFVSGPNNKKYLKITDRKKELLKTSGGKYVAPAPIESKLRELYLIDQAMIIGDKKNFVSALIVPNHEALELWGNSKGITFNLFEDLIGNNQVILEIQSYINRINKNLNQTEQIKKFVLLPTSWKSLYPNNEEAELTPTLKLKRRVIRKKYADQIQEIYNSK